MLDDALARGRTALNEYDAKRFLGRFGIPVCREALCGDAEAAAAEAQRLGFPVAVKAAGDLLLHKTEVQAVALNLRSESDVRSEAKRLLAIPGSEALLVQEMVSGDRELVCGLIRDRDFGPCVMFGIGGVLTEVFSDAVFRLAPLTGAEAEDMIRDIRHKRILGPFRGQAAVRADILARILVALGEIGCAHEAVSSLDINPLKVRPDGVPVAVDALVSLRRPGHEQ